jgi:hypothetical protein
MGLSQSSNSCDTERNNPGRVIIHVAGVKGRGSDAFIAALEKRHGRQAKVITIGVEGPDELERDRISAFNCGAKPPNCLIIVGTTTSNLFLGRYLHYNKVFVTGMGSNPGTLQSHVRHGYYFVSRGELDGYIDRIAGMIQGPSPDRPPTDWKEERVGEGEEVTIIGGGFEFNK